MQSAREGTLGQVVDGVSPKRGTFTNLDLAVCTTANTFTESIQPVLGTGFRQSVERLQMWIWLCAHHPTHSQGPHAARPAGTSGQVADGALPKCGTFANLDLVVHTPPNTFAESTCRVLTGPCQSVERLQIWISTQ